MHEATERTWPAAVALILLLSPLLPHSLSADDPQEYSMMLHLTPPGYAGCSKLPDEWLNCDMIEIEGLDVGPFTPFWAWLLVGGVSPRTSYGGGIGGIMLGIEYEPSIYVVGWNLCTGGSEIQFDYWPASGSGLAATWEGGCYDVDENVDGMTTIGWLTINPGSRGGMWVTDFPDSSLIVADCYPNIFEVCETLRGSCVMHPDDAPCDAYFDEHDIGNPFSPCNPCGGKCPVPVLESSWGSIKSMYRERQVRR